MSRFGGGLHGFFHLEEVFPMDLETIVGFISVQVASGFLKEHGKEIYQKVKGVLTDDELISLDLLEAYPENKELQDKVAGQLKAHLETSPAIAEELEALIAKFETKQNALSQTGDDNIALQDVHGSKINIGR
jgi:hypothetical protein